MTTFYPVSRAGAKTVRAEVLSIGAIDKQSLDNELLVNEIIHGGVSTLTNNRANQSEDSSNMKVKVREAMEKAFWDGILESLKGDTPDFGRIVKLVQEVRHELCEMSPRTRKQEIFDNIDVDILSQVLESATQDINYLGRVLEYALVTLQKLCAPANDNEMKKDCQILLSELASIAESDSKENSSHEAAIVEILEKITGESLNLLTKSQFQSHMLNHTDHIEDTNADNNLIDLMDSSDAFNNIRNNINAGRAEATRIRGASSVRVLGSHHPEIFFQ